MSKCTVHYEVQCKYVGPGADPQYDKWSVAYAIVCDIHPDHPDYTPLAEGGNRWELPDMQAVFDTAEFATVARDNMIKLENDRPEGAGNMAFRAMRINSRELP